MATRYSHDFPIRRRDVCVAAASSTAGGTSGDVILLTGTTGNLGCYLVDALVSSPEVARIYALNRAARDGTPLRRRQAAAMIERGLDANVLASPKLLLLEGNITDPSWGLSQDLFQEMHGSVTHIIHNAWHVDMAAPLSAFEPLVEGLRSLIDFALTTPLELPPRLLFTSSTAMLQRAPRELLVLERPVPAETAVTSGYTESKWVAEEVLYNAAACTELNTLVIRVGQASGGKSGAWAANEWYPIMVQSAAQLRCYPDDPRPINLIPYEYAAAAILDFRKASNATRTVHLVHPNPTSWHSLASVIAQEFGVPLVSYGEWMTRLEAAAAALPRDPVERKRKLRNLKVIKVIPWFQGMRRMYLPAHTALGFPDVDAAEAVRASPTLADPNLPQVGEEDVRRWLSYWRKVGLFSEERLARL
ncbi:uncharacterized protein FIBRA_00022 [Fibroporia radiculosa]|uniref:Thioester reductase (TE) domain-containing protein n=1 Tax=Fibroporia radiculosa TaxID=599839 RepID=J7S5I1_9APHY|nr:uncharacterized protein FIBRA_00022 [Fibroporia radiculosa]CCL98029.1 predicted protein [Fibroporia radiculosa]